jgi:predicted Fe-Mo cluster-binding NifX family protein
MEVKVMKIAAITEDGTTISQHFGRAPLYVVVTVEDGKITNKERRNKTGHHTFAAHHDAPVAPSERHGYDAGSQVRHASMAETIADCQVLIAGGMGWGAYESLKSQGIEPVVTDVESIEEAVKLYLQGKLPNLMERLH